MCLSAEICQNPKRDVRTVKSTKTAKKISHTKCTIEDAKLYFEEVEDNTFLQKSKNHLLA